MTKKEEDKIRKNERMRIGTSLLNFFHDAYPRIEFLSALEIILKRISRGETGENKEDKK